MPPPDEQLINAIRKKKIKELARSIRKKYVSLKLGKSEEDATLNKLFEPVVTPLKQLAKVSKTIRGDSSMIKTEVKQEERVKKEEPKSILFPKYEDEIEDAEELSSQPHDEEDVFEDSTSEPLQMSNVVLSDVLKKFPAIVRPFIERVFQKSEAIDRQYGPNYHPTSSKWNLGDKSIEFDMKSGDIKIGGRNFKGTNGLYELIFHDLPKGHSQSDLAAYKEILELSKIHKDTLGRLRHSKTQKYKKIIRPMFTEQTALSLPSRTRSINAEGRGMKLKYNNRPMEYVFWDDPNELVERLKLLIASQEAGNTSHDNEIVAIINELLEANIIKER